MTRSSARAIALSCIYESGFRQDPIDEILDYRLGPGQVSLAEEDPLYRMQITPGASAYIRGVVSACVRERDMLSQKIADLAIDWDLRRISKMTMAILQLALTEILFCDDVPLSTAINEAINLAKKYDTEKAPAFVNGILGKFADNIAENN